MKNKTPASVALIAVLLISALIASGCGSSDDSNSSNAADGGTTDSMFVNGMIPHHEAAIEMAELAQRKAQHEEVQQLADDIIASQTAEIEQMKVMQKDLPSTTRMGMSQSDMKAMNNDVDELRDASDFDKAFLLAMIPHHQMAVDMSQMVIRNGSDAAVEQLAKDIITAQQKELKDMNSWLAEWYDVTAPASSGSMHDDGHGGTMDHMR